jgi:hypothetical protein
MRSDVSFDLDFRLLRFFNDDLGVFDPMKKLRTPLNIRFVSHLCGLKTDIQIYISLVNYLKTLLKINTSPVPFPIAISGWVPPFRAPNLKIYGISWLRLSQRFLMFWRNGLRWSRGIVLIFKHLLGPMKSRTGHG